MLKEWEYYKTQERRRDIPSYKVSRRSSNVPSVPSDAQDKDVLGRREYIFRCWCLVVLCHQPPQLARRNAAVVKPNRHNIGWQSLQLAKNYVPFFGVAYGFVPLDPRTVGARTARCGNSGGLSKPRQEMKTPVLSRPSRGPDTGGGQAEAADLVEIRVRHGDPNASFTYLKLPPTGSSADRSSDVSEVPHSTGSGLRQTPLASTGSMRYGRNTTRTPSLGIGIPK